MIHWIVEAISRHRAREHAKGKAWAQALIQSRGVAYAEAEIETDQAMGWGSGPWIEGAVEAIREARADMA